MEFAIVVDCELSRSYHGAIIIDNISLAKSISLNHVISGIYLFEVGANNPSMGEPSCALMARQVGMTLR